MNSRKGLRIVQPTATSTAFGFCTRPSSAIRLTHVLQYCAGQDSIPDHGQCPYGRSAVLAVFCVACFKPVARTNSSANCCGVKDNSAANRRYFEIWQTAGFDPQDGGLSIIYEICGRTVRCTYEYLSRRTIINDFAMFSQWSTSKYTFTNTYT
jgi:hypothetical protein